MKFNYFLGIDVSKDSFDACLIDQEQKTVFNEKFSMDFDGFYNLSQLLTKYEDKPILTIMESTSIYHVNLYLFFVEKNISVAIINPILINNFSKSFTLRKCKTDSKDANLIAVFALFNQSKINTTLDVPESIRTMLRARDNLSKDIARLKTEIKSHLHVLFPELVRNYNVFSKIMLKLLLKAPGAHPIKKLKPVQIERIINKSKGNKLQTITPREIVNLAKKSIAHNDEALQTVLILKIEMLLFINKQKNNFDDKLKEFVKNNINDDFEIITSINGIGQTTAEKFLIEIGDVAKFDSHNQLRAFIGFDPSIKQSGSSINTRGRISKRGNAYLRRTLWQMATSVIRYCDEFTAYFTKKIKEGKKYKQAVVAVANKLIKTLYALLKNKVKYNVNFKNSTNVVYS